MPVSPITNGAGRIYLEFRIAYKSAYSANIVEPYPHYFSLQREYGYAKIRDMIYALVLRSDREDGIISPDPDHTRTELTTGETTISTSMTLLQTCKLVCDEATVELYGKNIFAFTEEDHEVRHIEAGHYDSFDEEAEVSFINRLKSLNLTCWPAILQPSPILT